jgi:hypothetical protein
MFCGSVIGIPSEIISPKKVAELHPLLNVHDLVGAMHVPEDAVVSSADVALALANAASQNGEWAFAFFNRGLGEKVYLRKGLKVDNSINSSLGNVSSLGYSASHF